METNDGLREIALGGGCHWCTEAVFQSLRGVRDVKQGWIASEGEADSFSEGVIVRYDPVAIRLDHLIEVHLHTHRSSSDHSMRGKFRSAIYFMCLEDEAASRDALDNLQPNFPAPLVTRVLPFREFKPSREEITDYYRKNPEKPFCVSYITPKLRMLQEKFPDILARWNSSCSSATSAEPAEEQAAKSDQSRRAGFGHRVLAENDIADASTGIVKNDFDPG